MRGTQPWLTEALIVVIGKGFTVIWAYIVSLWQPFKTLYSATIVSWLGVISNWACPRVAACPQKKSPPLGVALAISVAGAPKQIVGLLTVILGTGKTEMVAVLKTELQPFKV